MKEFTKIEKKTLEMLLDGDDSMLANLRRQLEVVIVSTREISGSGFFTHFILPQTSMVSAINPDANFKIGDVNATIEGLNFGAGFLLYVENGVISMLEAYSYDEPWPDTTDKFCISYVNGERDLEKLKSSWS